MRLPSWIALVAAMALAGCNVTPSARAPSVALPAQFGDGGGGVQPTTQWWREFKDPLLDRLEADVDVANPDLAAALASYQAARADAEAATSGLFPEVDFSGDLSYNKQSAHRPLRSSTQPTYYGANQIGAGVAGYEVDVWGRVRDLIKAADANAQAVGDALAFARLSLHAELARDYVELRGLDAQAKVLADTIKAYGSALQLTRDRLNAKIAPPIDEQRAEAQFQTAQAQATDLSVRRAELVDAIATLTGQPAAGFRLPPNGGALPYPRRPRAVPGDVLRRRPDVAQAERVTVAEANLAGAAAAARYPRFTIGLLGGAQDTGLDLLNLQNTMFSLGPSMTVPLFDFGLREAELQRAQALFRASAAHYRATVLNAVREVQDDLSAVRWLAKEESESSAAATAAGKALGMALSLYRDGAASYLDVITAQNVALLAQQAPIAVRTRMLQTNIALILALGGGWSVGDTVPAPTVADLARDDWKVPNGSSKP
jgi:NodT family efflux transporter outer membrane factor (OMF) lipoprotein